MAIVTQVPSVCYGHCRRSIRQRKGAHPDARIVIALAIVFGLLLIMLAIYIIVQWRRISGARKKALPSKHKAENPRSSMDMDPEFGQENSEFEGGGENRGPFHTIDLEKSEKIPLRQNTDHCGW